MTARMIEARIVTVLGYSMRACVDNERPCKDRGLNREHEDSRIAGSANERRKAWLG